MSRSPDTWGCETVQRLLEEWVDGEVTPEAGWRIRRHLNDCSSCAAQARLSAEIRSELRALPELDAPPDLLQSILDRGSPAGRRPGLIGERLGGWLPSWRPAWAALAAALLVLAIGLTVLQQAPSGESEPMPYQTVEVAQATAEARYALVKAGLLTAKAGEFVREHALVDEVVRPTRRSLIESLATVELQKGLSDGGVNDV